MKEYKKPVAEIVKFDSSEDSMRLVSGNYNNFNIIKSGGNRNVINF